VRDPRGFAIKLYTDEGNYDLVGNNTPIFFVRDPSKFQDFIHSQKRLPDTHLRSNDMQWDFWTLSPESAHQVSFLMSDRGTPRTWRNMNGYGSHTFLWENAGGEKFWVKYHFKTEQGIQNFTDAEARAMRAEDLDYHRRDLWEAIARKDYPSWRLEMQIMPYEDAANYRFNPFDITKVWPHKDYPTIPIGRMVLDSTVDPTGWWYQDGFPQARAIEARLVAFFSWIASHNAVYRLGTTRPAVERAWYRARADLAAHPRWTWPNRQLSRLSNCSASMTRLAFLPLTITTSG